MKGFFSRIGKGLKALMIIVFALGLILYLVEDATSIVNSYKKPTTIYVKANQSSMMNELINKADLQLSQSQDTINIYDGWERVGEYEDSYSQASAQPKKRLVTRIIKQN